MPAVQSSEVQATKAAAGHGFLGFGKCGMDVTSMVTVASRRWDVAPHSAKTATTYLARDGPGHSLGVRGLIRAFHLRGAL